MRAVVAQAKRTERAPINTLITGEPGTGKELLARIALGGAEVPVADLTLAGAPDASIASVTANGIVGPLLVLHVERLGPVGQARLLAAIRAGAGGRVVSTANASLRTAALEGRFDRLLYQALSTALVEVPPLRARPDDIGMLAVHFLKATATRDGEHNSSISHAAMRALRAYGWPENVPELRAAMEHASFVMRGDSIQPGDLPFVAARNERHPLAEMPYAEARARAVGTFEHEYVEALLLRTAKNYSAAAKLAGMDRANFRRLARRIEEGAVRSRSKREES
jgi:DNA-binding NtrC family response regulator